MQSIETLPMKLPGAVLFTAIQGGDFKNKQTTKQLFEQEYNCSKLLFNNYFNI